MTKLLGARAEFSPQQRYCTTQPYGWHCCLRGCNCKCEEGCFYECFGCSERAVFLCCRDSTQICRFSSDKYGEATKYGRCCICNVTVCECIEPSCGEAAGSAGSRRALCKLERSVCCIEERCACPCTEDVPCALAWCGIMCCCACARARSFLILDARRFC